LDGYTLLEEYPAAINNPGNTLTFVGHIYPRNGFSQANKKKPSGPDRPLIHVMNLVKSGMPARIIFGGDNVYQPTSGALEHLLNIKHSFPKDRVRFLLGNHDRYWTTLLEKPEQFRSIYGKRYFYEDVNGVRLIYLHTTQQHGQYGIDEVQLGFLQRILNPVEYRYALVFQHHALWAGDTLHANAPYDDAINTKQTWVAKILPTLKAGNVKAVFSGDGGWRLAGRSMRIDGIPHYISGWTWQVDIPPEWLTIELEDNSPKIQWHKLFDGDQYSKAVYDRP